MKKFLILSLALCVLIMTQAQKSKVSSAYSKIGGDAAGLAITKVSAEDLAAAKLDVEDAIKDDYTKTWAKTYIVAAQVYEESYRDSKNVADMDKVTSFLNLAKEWNIKGDAKGKGKGKFNDEIKSFEKSLKANTFNFGAEAYNANDFATAANMFGLSASLGHGELFAKDNLPFDTAVYFNAAICASRAEMHEDAIKYYSAVVPYGYEGSKPYLYMASDYDALNDSAGLELILKEGLSKYPNDGELLKQLTNVYLRNGNSEAAFTYLQKAIDKDPENSSLYFAQGVIYDQKNNMEAAENSYRKAIELDPSNADAQNNLGVIIFNKGVNIFNNASDIKDNNEYKAELEKANDQFKTALPFIEKANELKPNVPEYLNGLKQIYYRLKNEEGLSRVQKQLDSLNQN